MLALVTFLSVVLAAQARIQCYEEIGCLDSGYPFYDFPNRPVSFLPETRTEINTQFLLNTPTSRSTYEYINTYDDSSILNSKFNPNLETKIICHGYTENGYVGWMEDMMEALLTAGNYNVIRVDWRGGAIALYSIATANTRIVGAEISILIDDIKRLYPGTTAASARNYHIIGHSLGSHVAGYAGERQPDLGRITGMDPAGPYFEGTVEVVRLDPTDALFVDAIHTDTDPLYTLGLGIYEPVGHIDVYVNGGHNQPLCDLSLVGHIFTEGGIYEGGVQYVACNHLRSYEYFTESILSPCPWIAIKCESENVEDLFFSGNCFSGANIEVGFHAEKYKPSSGVVHQIYLDWTYGSEPYCAYQYRVQIYFDENNFFTDDAVGDMYITLIGTWGQTDEEKVGTGKYKPNTNHFFPMRSHSDLGTLTGLYFSWEYDADWYKPWTWEFWDNPDVYVHKILVKDVITDTDYIFCGSKEKIKSNEDTRAFFPVTTCN